ncbi:hypothetical protein QTP70_007393 [Hemibagrus guttatus]|uniref:Reverse transcriptase domain-containing protein n=1 Tax=Hemibagrus guttatus TaxID=175788 RepID=A0AAE0UXI9_9TELE|nr:hypothetical protein QTP70_007393 [Hemibagrus guttatus]
MDIYSTRCIRKANSIVDDPSHPSHTLFTLLLSGKRSSAYERRKRERKTETSIIFIQLITSMTPTSLASKQHIALLAVTEKLHAARSAKLSSVLILLDLSAAFDTVNHKTLLSTLMSLGICGTAWEWFASYLDGCSYQLYPHMDFHTTAMPMTPNLHFILDDSSSAETELLAIPGLPLNAIRPLQMIQNVAARLVFNLPKFSHTTPLLRSLHWILVAARIRFKTLMFAYKAKNGPVPSYLKALVTPHTAPHSFRSTSTARLVPPSLREKGCELEEKERFWSELDEVMESIPTGERVVIGADFNGHVGEGNRGDEEVMGKFGVKDRNLKDRW